MNQTIRQHRAAAKYIEVERAARSLRRSAVVHPFPRPKQPEPCNFCAEPDDTDSSLLMMIFGAVIGLIAWGVFGWAVVTVIEVLS